MDWLSAEYHLMYLGWYNNANVKSLASIKYIQLEVILGGGWGEDYLCCHRAGGRVYPGQG